MFELLAQDPPCSPGTYLLWFDLERPLQLVAGRLGPLSLEAGRYVYVGSALGPGGLRSRLLRHLDRERTNKRLHWHVDHLVAAAPPTGYRYALGRERLECAWGQKLYTAGATWPVPGFGSSDCRAGCGAHMVRIPDNWLIRTIEDVLS